MKKAQDITKNARKLLEDKGIALWSEKLKEKFSQAEVFLVGGAVRDLYLKRKIEDVDVMIRGVRLKELEKFLSGFGRVNVVGKRFSVLKFSVAGKGHIDIALPRQDFSFGTGGYRDVKVKASHLLKVEDDLSRRDFTINALALNVATGELIDLFGGLRDLQKGIIRAVGKPEQRFKDDYSRMLRAIRFATQLGFSIEKNTKSVIVKNIKKINSKDINGERKVPYEIISGEFLKSLFASQRRAIDMFYSLGALKEIVPELLALRGCKQPKEWHSEGDVWTHTLLALDMLESKEFRRYFKDEFSLEIKVAVLLHDIGKPKTRGLVDGKIKFQGHDKVGAEIASKLLARLKMSASPDVGLDCEEVIWLIKNHLLFCYSDPRVMKKTTMEKYLFDKRFSGEKLLQLFLADALATKPMGENADLGRFRSAVKIMAEMKKGKKELSQALLNGDEIMAELKLRPGKQVGDILLNLREEQLSGRINNKEQAKKFIKKAAS